MMKLITLVSMCLLEIGVIGSPIATSTTVETLSVECSKYPVYSCDRDILLHFPYDEHLNDVTCTRALSVQVGSGKVVLVTDDVRGKVAKFDGNGYLEVPYFHGFFCRNNVTKLSISFFFKPTSVSGKSAVISNSDCKRTSTFEAGYSSGKFYYQGKTTQNNLISTGLATVTINKWNHVALVFNGESIKVYFNSVLVSSEVMFGSMANNYHLMDVGARCGQFYHIGLVDELKVFARELSGHDITRLSKQ